ncbi:MAG: glutamine amidotransferase [Actinomycetota bacterium]|nr:glutamine amidotransferase [Actinomycetota bacterium]MDQ6945096.1 glutamine amidotransferase [Actinomycetota bacterium]
MSPNESVVTIALLFPDLLGTYGDGGNATILAQRLRWRGQAAEVITIRSGDAVPASADLYVVGGGEDLPQVLAARQLAGPPNLRRAAEAGASVFAVCAGLQILGTTFDFAGPEGPKGEGLGLVDVSTGRSTHPRAVGELVVDADPELGLPALTGYENHSGATVLGPGVKPLGRVRHGVGNGASTNGTDTKLDGYWSGHLLGTYLHGPALARNPALADLLLSWVVGDLSSLDDSESERLWTERLKAAAAQSRGGNGVARRWWRGRR